MENLIIKPISRGINTDTLLTQFLQNELPPTFRYFNTRSLDCLNNHLITIIALINNKPVGYGHLDCDNNQVWLGICVLPSHHRNGIGEKIIDYLLNFASEIKIDKVKLTVDNHNMAAIALYKKKGFNIVQIDNDNNKIYMDKIIPNINTITNFIELPVSFGEALDKLTILDIKFNKMPQCHQRNDVLLEKNLLYLRLNNIIESCSFYFNILKNINLSIWEKQDLFRDTVILDQKWQLCEEIILENDARFRVKNKINLLSNSYIKEQKNYHPKIAIVLPHLGFGDQINMIGMIRYFSTLYDTVILLCASNTIDNIQKFYYDDKSIIVHSIEHHIDYTISQLQKSYKNSKIEIFRLGMYSLSNKHPYHNLPFNFYQDANISTEIFYQYFYLPQNLSSLNLYQSINLPYIFIHNCSSEGKSMTENEIFNILNINPSKFLIINPNQNYYPLENDLHTTANIFINKPFVDYVDLIINAKYVICVDSAFFCLAIQLPIKTDNCYYFTRTIESPYLYSHLFNDGDSNHLNINKPQYLKNFINLREIKPNVYNK